MAKLVFLHGWALNSGVWEKFTERLAEMDSKLKVECIDLPGYGNASEVAGAHDLELMAQYCLQKVQEPAIWVGWSLGGMVAMQAALQQPSLVMGMQLICTSPKFVESVDWHEGVDIETFKLFSNKLANDYERALITFLLLQAGDSANARCLAREAHLAICKGVSPSPGTLADGIRCLAKVDLRDRLNELKMPIQIVSGLRDRVTKPASSARLADMLGAELLELDTGHAPFMSEPDIVASNLLKLIAQVSDEPR